LLLLLLLHHYGYLGKYNYDGGNQCCHYHHY
jgi:hypothetical protein